MANDTEEVLCPHTLTIRALGKVSTIMTVKGGLRILA